VLKQIYQSAVLPYRLPWLVDTYPGGIPNGSGTAALYNSALITPPRIYGEEIDFLLGMAAFSQTTGNSESSIRVWGFTKTIYWPSYQLVVWRFDATNGAFMDRQELAGSINYYYQTFQSADGSLWQTSNIGTFRQVDSINFAAIPGSTERDAADFGYITIDTLIVDQARDLTVMSGTGGSSAGLGLLAASMTVHTLSTGEMLRRVTLAGKPKAITPEDATRCYVLTHNSILHLVDYSTGVVINTVRVPEAVDEFSFTTQTICWDRYYRRLLFFSKSAPATNGAGTSRIRGYYPIPLATHLLTPIPLKPPRRGREIPILLRAVGDLGEPLSGVASTLVSTGTDARISSAPGVTTADGETQARVTCDAAGSISLTASATVND
jgi:hypothetical protein